MTGTKADGKPAGRGEQAVGPAKATGEARPAKGRATSAKADEGPAGSPFWAKPLEDLSHKEWEALCDGCGRCCLAKLEEEDTAEIYYTDIVCTLFDTKTCRCADYANRREKVPDCITLSMKNVRALGWLPPTCAYRLRAEGKPLAWWHPLVSGTPDTVHEAGISVLGRAGPSEDDVALEDYPDHIVQWPAKFPKSGKAKLERAQSGQPKHKRAKRTPES
jgi:uncharacterized cysteine cluster protein YcgN (CxxCxxCC family)